MNEAAYTPHGASTMSRGRREDRARGRWLVHHFCTEAMPGYIVASNHMKARRLARKAAARRIARARRIEKAAALAAHKLHSLVQSGILPAGGRIVGGNRRQRRAVARWLKELSL